MLRIFLCIGFVAFCLYSYIDTQNAVTRLRLEIPLIAGHIKDLKEKNTQLQYEIDLFESPEHLIQLARTVEFSHLKYPIAKQVLKIHEGIALDLSSEKRKEVAVPPKATFIASAH